LSVKNLLTGETPVLLAKKGFLVGDTQKALLTEDLLETGRAKVDEVKKFNIIIGKFEVTEEEKRL